MNSYTHKVTENNIKAVSKNTQNQQHAVEPAFFIDNREEAIMHRNLQEGINNSPKIKQLKAYQAMADNAVQKQVKLNENKLSSNTVQLQPAAEGFGGTDELFTYNVVLGQITPSGGEISVSVDSGNNILFAIPFNDHRCQIHIHYTPADVQYVTGSTIMPGDTARAHVYNQDRSKRNICNIQAIPMIIQCIPAAKMLEAKMKWDLQKMGRRTYRSLTATEMAMRGDHK